LAVRDPVADNLIKFHGGHAGVRDRDDFENSSLSAGERTFEVTLEQRGKRLLVPPLRMLGGQYLYAVESEGKLEIDRLLRPQRAVIVEGSNPFGRWYQVGRTLLGHAFDEGDDGLLGRRIVP